MALSLKTIPALETDRPVAASDQASNSSLEIVVLHTNQSETLAALKMAAELASGLALVRLLAIQVVPYPLGLDAPQVSTQFLESLLLGIAKEAGVDTTVDIRLGRDTGDVLESGLGPHSVVVIGGRRRRWPTATMRLARRLEGLGHQAVFARGK